MKPEKSFGEIWSELTDEQSEYLKGYINRQRIDATNIHERVSTKQIKKLEADKAELLEALEESNLQIEYLHEKFKETGSGNAIISKNKSLIQKHKQ